MKNEATNLEQNKFYKIQNYYFCHFILLQIRKKKIYLPLSLPQKELRLLTITLENCDRN